MKNIIAIVLAALMLLSCAACSSSSVSATDPVAAAEAWIERQMRQDTLFSFEYEGKPFANHIKKWKKTVQETEGGWTLSYQKDDVTVWAEISLDEELAALAWTCYFKNNGTTASPVIGNILAVDSSVEIENPVLTTAEGSDAGATDFQAISVDLAQETAYQMASNGGRPSQGAWPYFDISNGEYGVIGGIGWTGNWKADFVHDSGTVSLAAGMQQTRISLLPQEQIRTPMVLLTFFSGDQDAGHNALRQVILKSYTPKDESGTPISHAIMVLSSYGGRGEDPLLEIIARWKGHTYEHMWIDAGWYGTVNSETMAQSSWASQVGNWFTVDGYTDGSMRKVTDALAREGKGLVLWFEPERVMAGTEIAEKYPQYLLPQGNDSFRLFDLSNDEACDYMIDLIGDFIDKSNIAWYRQDFNCNPDQAWARKDKELGEDRVGITEIRYITNEYRFLDTLIERNPGLMIDNCASGGKRLDLEMMKRSIPMWRSDYTATSGAMTPNGVRAINFNLSWWLPIHGGGMTGDYTAYNWRCAMASGLFARSGITDFEMLEQAAEQYFTCREMMVGDYYILAQGRDGMIEKQDACYQYYLPDEGRGYLMAFCPERVKAQAFSYRLKGLDAKATYEITVSDTGDVLTATGEELMTKGLEITFYKENTSYLIFYHK